MPSRLLFLALLLGLGACGGTPDGAPEADAPGDRPFLVVLGIGQDGGVPQTGDPNPAKWTDPSRQRRVVSLGLVDPASGQRWLFEATPDLPEQLAHLDLVAPVDLRWPTAPARPPGLNGIFLTHAHIGHYTGLMFLGHESLGASGVPVYAMPRMAAFLRTNGPWSQLVTKDNIALREMEAGKPVRLNGRLSVTPLLVPHRQEFSEVVGFRIEGPERSVLFIPDIDSWEEWDAQGTRIEDEIARVDVAYLDATFFANGEIPGRDMSGFPHPFVTHSMERFSSLPASERAKVRFLHLNHTNPSLWPGDARDQVREAGHHVADEGEVVAL